MMTTLLARLFTLLMTAEGRVIEVAGRDVLLVKRFDRARTADGYVRVRMISALTLLRTEDNCQSRGNVLTTAIRHQGRITIVYTLLETLMRDAAINLRARPEQRDLIDRAAQLLGKSRADFMLEAACAKAQSVLLDQVFFRLDADKLRQFTKLLDAPPARNLGLERLMAVKPLWGKKSIKA